MVCVKFTLCSRVRRASKQCAQSANRSKSHKSTKIRPSDGRSLCAASQARSMVSSRGSWNCPSAAIASIAFAPEIVIPAVEEMHRRYGEHIYGKYGFYDAFNPSFNYDVPLRHGRTIAGFGWVDTDYLGIDQGPILAMIENYRTGLVWRVMRSNPHIRAGLEQAGFQGGWLTKTKTPNAQPSGKEAALKAGEATAAN